MFTAEIAGIPFAIDSHFDAVRRFFKAYLTDRQPLFTVSASKEEMMLEGGILSAHTELLCILRKIAVLLPDYDAFLMHAAVIDIDGQGVAFAAKSGTGKTTRVNLWKTVFGDRLKIVNGDKPILRFLNGVLYAFGTPWMGKEKLGENTYVRMKAVCFIERGDTVSLRRLSAEEIAPRLFHQVLMPKEADRLRTFIPLMERFAQSVPFYLHSCNQEKEAPEDIWKTIREE